MVRQALAGAGLTRPPRAPAARPTAAPAPRRSPFALRPALAAAAALAVLVGAVALWRGLGAGPAPGPAPAPVAVTPVAPPPPATAPATAPAPAPEMLAGRLTQARRTTLDGQPASVGAEVRAGAALHVGPGGHAEVALERGGRVRLYPRAEARLQGSGDEVALASGRVWCQIDSGRGGFRVHTEEADARVVGTSFVVERQAGHTDVRVMQGAVDVQDAGKKGSVRVKARERTRVEKRTAPSRVRRYAPDSDSGDWDRMLTDIRRALQKTGRAIERGLKSLGDKLK
jgi:ferric-dicitrate binding protein FerR (iron transport regulator)